MTQIKFFLLTGLMSANTDYICNFILTSTLSVPVQLTISHNESP